MLRSHAPSLRPPEIVSFEKDSVTYYGSMYKPDPAVHGEGPYPTVVSDRGTDPAR